MLERYNPMLTAIRTLCPTAHIAGGAVRDTLLEKPIKDIDLFLGCGPGQSTLLDAAKLLRSDFGFVKVGEWVQYEMFSDPAVVAWRGSRRPTRSFPSA
jgi:tRNA nucleotidyltransferase/poly(A) polymerase